MALGVRVYPDRAGNLRVGLQGELDGHTAPLLEIVLNAAEHRRKPGRQPGTVIFDLAGVQFIYMRGIAVLQEVCVRLSGAGWQVSFTNAPQCGGPVGNRALASVTHGDRTRETLPNPGGNRGPCSGTAVTDLMVGRVDGLRTESVQRIARGRANARYEVLGSIAGSPVWAWPHRWSTALSHQVDALIAGGEVVEYPELGVRFLATRTGPDLPVVRTLARALDVIQHLRLGQVVATVRPLAALTRAPASMRHPAPRVYPYTKV